MTRIYTKGPGKESSRARLRALQAVLKILVESPRIQKEINEDWVRKTAHSGSTFTSRECMVVAYLANLLQPFTPKRSQDDNDETFKDPLAHIALRAPIVMIANAVLRATGYPNLIQNTTPVIAPSSLQAIPLGASGIYEVFCGRREQQFDIVGNDMLPLTDIKMVTSNKSTVFSSFFDLKKIEDICDDHGLRFRGR